MSSNPKLIASIELVRRTIETEAAYTLSRLKVLERLPGNPAGIAYREIGDGAVALMAEHLPVPDFNSVIGLRAGQEREIGPLIAWYREHGVQGRFEIVPGLVDASIGRELCRSGYLPSGFNASLICEPDTQLHEFPGLTIEKADSSAVLGVFLETYAASWNIPGPEAFKANVQGWLSEPGWSLYLARLNGEPAATGILYMRGKAGYCADGATRPQFRGRGLQLALLRRRIADASAAGAGFVCGAAAYLSTSHRNMERAGMRVQLTRALWTCQADP
jgi:hypothetical protein